jgi:hypothetical protein
VNFQPEKAFSQKDHNEHQVKRLIPDAPAWQTVIIQEFDFLCVILTLCAQKKLLWLFVSFMKNSPSKFARMPEVW